MKVKQLIAVLAACLILVATGFMGALSARQERSLIEETGTDIVQNALPVFIPAERLKSHCRKRTLLQGSISWERFSPLQADRS